MNKRHSGVLPESLSIKKGVKMRTNKPNREGKVGWILLWLLGVPLPILAFLFLIRGCT